MAAAEFETIDEGGFIFKIRKSRLEELEAAAQLPSGVKEGELPDVEDSEPVAEDQSSEDDKKRKRLLALKAIYEKELEAWERLEAAATSPVVDEPASNSVTLYADHQEEYLRELKIEVENVEEYIKLLEDHISLAESTYKTCVRELREDANFRPADEAILSLTGQATPDVVAATPAFVKTSTLLKDLENLD